MHSFKSDHNEVQWKLVVRADLAGWPSFERRFLSSFIRRNLTKSRTPPRNCNIKNSRSNPPPDEHRAATTVDQHSTRSRQRVFQPGEVLAGAFQIDAVEPEELTAIEVSVLWFTEGKGEEDLAVHYFERLEAD